MSASIPVGALCGYAADKEGAAPARALRLLIEIGAKGRGTDRSHGLNTALADGAVHCMRDAARGGAHSEPLILLDLLRAPPRSALRAVANALQRMENLSHILAWGKTRTSLDIVELPRLGLTFVRDASAAADAPLRLRCAQLSGMYLATAPSTRAVMLERVQVLARGLSSALLMTDGRGKHCVRLFYVHRYSSCKSCSQFDSLPLTTGQIRWWPPHLRCHARLCRLRSSQRRLSSSETTRCGSGALSRRASCAITSSMYIPGASSFFWLLLLFPGRVALFLAL